MKTATLTLNEVEANELIKLIDLAVKSGGLQYAENAAVLYTKVRQAFEPQPTKEPINAVKN